MVEYASVTQRSKTNFHENETPLRIEFVYFLLLYVENTRNFVINNIVALAINRYIFSFNSPPLNEWKIRFLAKNYWKTRQDSRKKKSEKR